VLAVPAPTRAQEPVLDADEIVRSLGGAPAAAPARTRSLGAPTRGIAGVRAGRQAFDNIVFQRGAATIDPPARAQLDQLGLALRTINQRDRSARFVLEGHTDSAGDSASNQQLSLARAQAIHHYLVDRFGLPADRLIAVGRGETQPIATNSTADGRRQNRRVVIARKPQ